MQTLEKIKKNNKVVSNKLLPYTPLDFYEIEKKAENLADIIETRFEDLAEILLEYESYEVVRDETDRTLDLLRNLKENKKYFKLRAGAVAAFLPRNQPLYTFVCFVIVPALMASEVHFRIPCGMRGFFPKMLALLDISKLFPNVFVSSKQRLEFLIDRSALLVNPKTEESTPVTDVVIFTGTSAHADQLRMVFDKRTLFIANGAGHNPMVISQDADLSRAVEAVLLLQFYNQGQDCAAPNAILVHKNIMSDFLKMLRVGVGSVKVGHYRDRSCRIGPISEPKDIVRIQDFLVEHREWLDPSTTGIIRTYDAIVEPTIICKPLATGGNFREIFAPIIFVQAYEDDSELKLYFEDSHYERNAMYISLYGKSKYVENLVDRSFNGKILHDKKSILRNINPHVPGFERGTQPYGGYGYKSSSISLNGKITAMPTLPQRDIYERIIKPMLCKKGAKINEIKYQKFTELQYKNVEKLLRLQSLKESKCDYNNTEKFRDVAYFDLHSVKKNDARYIKIEDSNTYYLLSKPNIKHITSLNLDDIRMIQKLKELLPRKFDIPLEEFRAAIYAIPKHPKMSEAENKKRQIHFFQHIYQLLFGEKSGPQLAPFLRDAEPERIKKLLGI